MHENFNRPFPMTAISSKVFEHFFKHHYQPLCLFALHYTGNLDDAEDIVQHSFSEIWNRISTGSPIENLKAYAYRCVRNNALSMISNRPETTTLMEHEADFEDMSEEERIFCAERDARLWRAIDSLPTERRRIFLLAKRDGMKYQEIADELRISVKTVENQMTKAIKTLRETAIKIYHYFF